MTHATSLAHATSARASLGGRPSSRLEGPAREREPERPQGSRAGSTLAPGRPGTHGRCTPGARSAGQESHGTHERPDRPPARPRADRDGGGTARRAHPGVARDLRARTGPSRRRRRLLVPGAQPLADLPRARGGARRLGRRRQPDVGLPQRLRLDGAGSCAPRHRPGDRRALPPRYALRGTDRGRHRRRRRARTALGAAQVALHQLGLRVDDGRDPDRPRVHGPRHRDEDLRLLPRPPRHRHGLDRRRVRQDRRPREPRLAGVRRGDPCRRPWR